MSRVLIYEFIDNPITNAIIIVKPTTQSIVFVALGNTKPRLLSAAKQFTRTIAAKPEYLLKNIKYLKDEDVEWFQLICEKFKSS